MIIGLTVDRERRTTQQSHFGIPGAMKMATQLQMMKIPRWLGQWYEIDSEAHVCSALHDNCRALKFMMKMAMI